jgi:hypothetical protein
MIHIFLMTSWFLASFFGSFFGIIGMIAAFKVEGHSGIEAMFFCIFSFFILCLSASSLVYIGLLLGK